jgi:cytochrome P450
MFAELAKEFGFPGLYYIDLFPFFQSMVVCTDPAVVAQTESVRRDPWALTFMRGLVGTKSLFSTTGQEWKAQRSWFLPAFSLSNIITLVPGMVEEVLVFKEKLTKLAVSGETFSMGDAATRLTVDLIARSAIGARFQSQSQDNPIHNAFQGALDWTAPINSGLIKRLLSPFMMDMYTRRLDKLLLPLIKEQYSSSNDSKGTKSIIDLALRGYMKENGKLGNDGRVDTDSAFMQIALDK